MEKIKYIELKKLLKHIPVSVNIHISFEKNKGLKIIIPLYDEMGKEIFKDL